MRDSSMLTAGLEGKQAASPCGQRVQGRPIRKAFLHADLLFTTGAN